jgi:hypothetical protein
MKEKVDPETLGAILARENVEVKKERDSLYNKLRKLENEVRLHATNGCGCTSPHSCLAILGGAVPVHKRPTLRKIKRTGGL